MPYQHQLALDQPADSESPLEEAQVISRSTVDDAVSDGTLIDCRARDWPYFDAATDSVVRQHFRDILPVYLSRGVAALIAKAVDNKRAGNDAAGVLHDIFMMAFLGRLATWIERRLAAGQDAATREFRVIIRGAGRRSNYDLVASVDADGLVFMFPGER